MLTPSPHRNSTNSLKVQLQCATTECTTQWRRIYVLDGGVGGLDGNVDHEEGVEGVRDGLTLCCSLWNVRGQRSGKREVG